MLRWVTVFGMLGGSIGAAAAEPVHMSGDDIKHVLQPGALLEIDTPLHVRIPVRVISDGLVSGEAGALGLTLGALKDRGRWWTEGDLLCVKWFRWFDAKKRCVSLQRDGSKVLWQEVGGETGTGVITEAPGTVIASTAAPAPLPRRIETVATEDRASVNEISAPPSVSEPSRRLAAAAMREEVAQKVERGAEVSLLEVEAAPEAVSPVPAPREVSPPKRRQEKARPTSPPPTAIAPLHKAPRHPVSLATKASSTAPVSPVSFRVSGVVEGDMLNVRSGPSEYHQAVGSIPAHGRGVQIVGGCRELWCPIRHGRLKGWVNRYYLAEDAGQASTSRPKR